MEERGIEESRTTSPRDTNWQAIAAGGHEIGCHGDEHERVSGLEPKQEEAILKKSLETLTFLEEYGRYWARHEDEE